MLGFIGCTRLLMLAGVAASVTAASAALEFDIEFGFNNKPPLFYFEDGNAVGDVVDVTRQACKVAVLRCVFTELPFQRVMLKLEQRPHAFAALGFSRTPEREKFVTFSEPVWQDEGPILLVRAADKKPFQEYATLADMLERSRYIFGGKLGNVYSIDEQLRALGARDTRFIGETVRLPLLLVSERFDFTMMYPSELLPALQASGIVPQAVAIVTYHDMPHGSERYLLFGKDVAPLIVNKINAALKKLRRDGKIATLH